MKVLNRHITKKNSSKHSKSRVQSSGSTFVAKASKGKDNLVSLTFTIRSAKEIADSRNTAYSLLVP
jgi:hypothetical protein